MADIGGTKSDIMLDRIWIPDWTLCTSVALQAAVCDCMFWLGGMKGKKSEGFLELWVNFISLSPSWSVRNVYHVREKWDPVVQHEYCHNDNANILLCERQWLFDHLTQEDLEVKSTQRSKGYLHTMDNSSCKLPVCHLNNCFYVQLFE